MDRALVAGLKIEGLTTCGKSIQTINGPNRPFLTVMTLTLNGHEERIAQMDMDWSASKGGQHGCTSTMHVAQGHIELRFKHTSVAKLSVSCLYSHVRDSPLYGQGLYGSEFRVCALKSKCVLKLGGGIRTEKSLNKQQLSAPKQVSNACTKSDHCGGPTRILRHLMNSLAQRKMGPPKRSGYPCPNHLAERMRTAATSAREAQLLQPGVRHGEQ